MKIKTHSKQQTYSFVFTDYRIIADHTQSEQRISPSSHFSEPENTIGILPSVHAGN